MARRHERTHSTRRLIRAGVPQGSALSPLLYSAYTNDIPRPTSGIVGCSEGLQQGMARRKFTFRHESTYYTKRTLKARVPQGSTLSLLLYSAYVNDIPRSSNGLQLALFADDTALYLRGSRFRYTIPRLQRAIDELT
ncbi:Probable RNA-directed DNA polymerase from transposon BS [Eumeta japonica]|uniref:Probable RNA-directed DNA polymerase from transposon BS n=1 Tax=Eumeta variegata TaxID=151549 RepID=A0A4C1SWY7_EUMVA|nr:Probable RNA-directed DNA polymerase from transposon BS [Eumeta japonica]